jgi:hypothetical protein
VALLRRQGGNAGPGSKTRFKTRTRHKVRTEMSLHLLAYNLKRVVAMLGPRSLIEAIRA